MKTFGTMIREYRWLALVLLLAAATATGIVSCGGGSSGGTDGLLCEQCGVTDGPCISPAFILPGANEPVPCPTAPLEETCVSRELICRRGVDTARQRCYPANAGATDVDPGFRCKGVRPGSTLAPPSATPSAATPVPTPTKTAFPSNCGDGQIQGLEECEGSTFGNASCGNRCSGDGTGRLQCFSCVIDTTLCDGPCP